MAGILLDVKYNEELVKDIQEVFIHRIVPDNFVLVIHKYNRDVLTFDDIERIRKMISLKSSKEVNYELLLTMKKYKGWFEVILQVCNDPDVRQSDLAEAFQTIKGELDESWTKQHTKSKDAATILANLSLTSKSNPGTSAMECLLPVCEGMEADSGAVCMSSESRYLREKSIKFSTEDQNATTHQSTWKGFQLKNEKPYCNICLKELTSQTAASDHFTGKQHQKKLKAEATVVSPDSNFAAASKQASGSDEECIVVNDKGQLECRICKVPVTGGDSAIQHLQGSKHKKTVKALHDLNETPPELGPHGEILVMYESGAGKCFVCKIPINSSDSARQHIEGRKHINLCKKYNLPVK